MGRKKKNSEALEGLVKSNFLKSLKEEYIRHLTAHNIHGTVESTVVLNVFKDGSVKYEEKDKNVKGYWNFQTLVMFLNTGVLTLQHYECTVFFILLVVGQRTSLLRKV